jgi:hypothetical protein
VSRLRQLLRASEASEEPLSFLPAGGFPTLMFSPARDLARLKVTEEEKHKPNHRRNQHPTLLQTTFHTSNKKVTTNPSDKNIHPLNRF